MALTPGPAVLCAMSQATRYGLRNALAGIAGILLGHVVFFGCVGFGLAALLSVATTSFAVLRVAGAMYLIYIGTRILASTFRDRASAMSVQTVPPPARSTLLLQGFAIQVTNPKALLFMSALLPQFIRPDQPLALQFGVLLAITIAVDATVLGSYAYLARTGVRTLRAAGITVWLERALGTGLLVCGVRLLAARR